MTTLRDYLDDLITEAMQFGAENNPMYNPEEAQEKKEALLDEYTDYIIKRIVG